MPTWTNKYLEIQFKRVINLGWLEIFKQAANKFKLPVEILIAIGSRETNLDPKYQSQTGDGGHGHSIMQIDDRSYPEFCESGAWKDVTLAIPYGAGVLNDKLKQVKSTTGIPEDKQLQVAIAGYNCGATRAINNFRSGRPIDANTTGKDYSSDVLKRAKYFKERIDAYGQ